MQNEAHNDVDPISVDGRLLGFVRVIVGGRVFSLAVQCLALTKDGDRAAGGFFSKDGQLGILVDEQMSPSEAHAQIERATDDAVRHLSQHLLN